MDTQEIEYYFIETRAPEEVIKSRLRERKYQQNVISDARLEDFEELSEYYEPPAEIASDRLLTIETHHPVSESVTQLYQQLAQMNLK